MLCLGCCAGVVRGLVPGLVRGVVQGLRPPQIATPINEYVVRPPPLHNPGVVQALCKDFLDMNF